MGGISSSNKKDDLNAELPVTNGENPTNHNASNSGQVDKESKQTQKPGFFNSLKSFSLNLTGKDVWDMTAEELKPLIEKEDVTISDKNQTIFLKLLKNMIDGIKTETGDPPSDNIININAGTLKQQLNDINDTELTELLKTIPINNETQIDNFKNYVNNHKTSGGSKKPKKTRKSKKPKKDKKKRTPKKK